MKTKSLLVGALMILFVCGRASAGMYTFTGPFADEGAGAGVIPDNSKIGLSDSETLSGMMFAIQSVTLKITFDGTYYSDLTGYLRLGNTDSSPSYTLDSALTASGPVITTDVTSSFFNLSPNNNWTIFFADQSPGGQNTLGSWELDITAVPEPVNAALAGFGGLALVGGLVRSGVVRKIFPRLL